MYFDVVKEIGEKKLISILRGIDIKDCLGIVDALTSAGITTLEIASNTKNAVEIIKKINEQYGDKILLGAGTVLDIVSAKNVIDNGCKYILSPVYSEDVLKLANKYDVLYIPGVFSPNEIMNAWLAGVKVQKVFPATSLSKTFIKDVKSTIKDVELIPVGGINIDNCIEYLELGAFAVGIGSSLVSANKICSKNYAPIYETAKKYVNIVGNLK